MHVYRNVCLRVCMKVWIGHLFFQTDIHWNELYIHVFVHACVRACVCVNGSVILWSVCKVILYMEILTPGRCWAYIIMKIVMLK